MNNDQLRKHLTLSFLAALVLYIVGFAWVEHRRTRLGPWEITFNKEPGSSPVLNIRQDRLDIKNVEIEILAGQESPPATNARILFMPGRPVPFPVPFGQCVFQDPTFLPGTVTLDILGHEIQILPRILTVDGREHPWKSQSRLTITPVPTNAITR